MLKANHLILYTDKNIHITRYKAKEEKVTLLFTDENNNDVRVNIPLSVAENLRDNLIKRL